MTNALHQCKIIIEQAQVPLGWEALAECGKDQGEAVRLCQRLRDANKAAVVVCVKGWNTVWVPPAEPWPPRKV